MTVLGLGSKQSPFLYLDQFVEAPDWQKLHVDVSFGIAQSTWNKRFVSSGVHPDWADNEITPLLKQIEWEGKHLTEYERELYNKMPSYEEKIKFISALMYRPHPFWVIFIRNNQRKEISGVFNKAKAEDCEWTENAKYFPSLVEFINKLPFAEIGRVMLFITEANNQTVPHYDSKAQSDRPNDDFIWFTTKPNTKKVFVMDSHTKEKFYPEEGKKLVWFNEMDFHGTDPMPHMAFSIRIDGVFTPEVKAKLML